MRIAIFTNNYLPNPYGVAGSVESFRKEFERLGHEVFIFAPRWKGYKDANPRVYRYPSIDVEVKIKFPLAFPYSWKVSKVLENLDLDIIHSQHPNLLGTAAMRWARKKNIPLVFTWHALYDQYVHFAPFIPKKIATWWIIQNARNYANKCDTIITPTESVIEIIKRWGVKNKTIISIPTGVEEEQFANPDGENIRRKYNIQENDILLVLVARLTVEKNVEFLEDAVSQVLQRNKQAKFMLCGDGNLKEKLKKNVATKGLSDRVIFTGTIGTKEKKDYFAAGDIFVYASKSETQGMVLTEAMYSGLPIVAVRATGVKDIVEDGRTGFLVEENKKVFSEAVQKLIDDSESRRRFGEEAKKVAQEKFTSVICAKKMLEVYERVIETKKQKPNTKDKNQK